MHGLPVSSGGANPVRAVLLSGGRFVYVLNQGTPTNGKFPCNANNPCLNSNVTEFVVGGNGVLTAQGTFYTQGSNPIRMVSDTSGNYLYILDHDAPSGQYCGTIVTGATECGDITVFKVDGTTGRLSLVSNAQLTASSGSSVTYFPLPADPIDLVLASGYVMTLNGAAGSAQTVYPYGYSSSSGQLTVSQSAPQVINNGSGSPVSQATAIVYAARIYVLDNEAITVTSNSSTTTSPSQVLPFTIGTNGALQSQTGGAVPGDPTEANPIYLISESKGKFVYVANQSGASASSGSGIAGYVVDPASSQLSLIAGEPFPTGSNPQCLLEDPSNQFIYTANANDSTVTGRVIDPNSGVLNPMHGSTGVFPLNGPASWCVATGRTN